jgi:hypothetical protein
MPDADNVIVLPVPVAVQAIYLVPTTDSRADPAQLVRQHAAGRWQGKLGDLFDQLLAGPYVPVELREVDEIPPLPLDLLAVMGATEEQLDRVETATHYAITTLHGAPGWPPVHEWLTRATATVVAEQLGSDVIDVLNYQVLTVAKSEATLPNADGVVRLADWVWVDYSPDRAGYWCTTTGLRRFGLPELQALAAPPNVVEPWGQAMTGLAHRLLARWKETLSFDRGAAFLQLPSTLDFSAQDIAVAYGEPAAPDGDERRATVRLSLEPGLDPEQHSFLTIQPPLSWSGSAGEHMAEVCGMLVGTRTGEIRHAHPSELMDRAIAIARGGLTEIRERFEAGELNLREKLLVKYALPADGGTEYLWAYVTSWRDPYRILGTSAADAVYSPKVRSGRPVVVDTAAVVDWAIQHDTKGIIEGGWTQTALEDED